MRKFLKQAVTGALYHWNEHLAKRPDMFPADPEDVPVSLGGKKGAKHVAKEEPKVETEDDPKVDPKGQSKDKQKGE